jgi:hypothetical protein
MAENTVITNFLIGFIINSRQLKLIRNFGKIFPLDILRDEQRCSAINNIGRHASDTSNSLSGRGRWRPWLEIMRSAEAVQSIHLIHLDV